MLRKDVPIGAAELAGAEVPPMPFEANSRPELRALLQKLELKQLEKRLFKAPSRAASPPLDVPF